MAGTALLISVMRSEVRWAGSSGKFINHGTASTIMNLSTASRHNQHWKRAGIEGSNRQIVQTTSTTRPPCQQARHIVVAQVSSRMFMIDLPFAHAPGHAQGVS